MIKKYLKESFAELHNVTWPTRKQGIRITTIVFAFMVVSAIVFGAVDQVFAWAVRSLMAL
jgi:preprotein translocase SecE subunit